MQQGSDEWLMARLGCATASRMGDITARTKTGWGASRENYKSQLVVERLTQTPQDSYQNQSMRDGIEREPEAREVYSFYRDCDVQEVGFILHPGIVMAGASPDGFVFDDGMLEIKCPATATHIATLLGAPIDGKYIKQVQFQMACTGRKWCDFVSYSPLLPEEMRLFVHRVHRDESMIAELEKQVREFLAEVAQQVDELTDKYLRRAAA